MDDRTIDRVFAGCLEELPSVSSKIVRIFTSSTFTGTFGCYVALVTKETKSITLTLTKETRNLWFVKPLVLLNLDTALERNTLMAEVYPKIKEYCREKHGLEFQVGQPQY